MQDVMAADRAAFARAQGVDFADRIIAESGIRIGPNRRRGRGAAVNPTGRFAPFSRALAQAAPNAGSRRRAACTAEGSIPASRAACAMLSPRASATRKARRHPAPARFFLIM